MQLLLEKRNKNYLNYSCISKSIDRRTNRTFKRKLRWQKCDFIWQKNTIHRRNIESIHHAIYISVDRLGIISFITEYVLAAPGDKDLFGVAIIFTMGIV